MAGVGQGWALWSSKIGWDAKVFSTAGPRKQFCRSRDQRTTFGHSGKRDEAPRPPGAALAGPTATGGAAAGGGTDARCRRRGFRLRGAEGRVGLAARWMRKSTKAFDSCSVSPAGALGGLELHDLRSAKPEEDVDQLIKLIIPGLADDRGKAALGNRLIRPPPAAPRSRSARHEMAGPHKMAGPRRTARVDQEMGFRLLQNRGWL